MSIIRSPEVQKLLATLAVAVVIAALALSCAPASNEGGMDNAGGMDMAGMAPAEGDVDLKIGETAPPFAMILADGSNVSSADLAASGRPAHLFWFATW